MQLHWKPITLNNYSEFIIEEVEEIIADIYDMNLSKLYYIKEVPKISKV